MAISVKIKNQQRRLQIDPAALEALTELVLKEEGREEGEVSYLFINNARIRELNRNYLERDYPTDVLSFPQAEERGTRAVSLLLGDVVVSTQRARESAAEFGQTVNDEFTLYVIHGLLHLLGYHDHPPRARREMASREEALLKAWKRSGRWSLIKS